MTEPLGEGPLNDLTSRIRRAKEHLIRKLVRKVAIGEPMNDTPEFSLPPPERFIPLATIFKLDPPGENLRTMVHCVACGASYPLRDLLEDELNDDQCPTCKTRSGTYWSDKPHRKVPHG